ncbi:hypothetical protein YW3DRAFT_00732 [Streptomyces sp. MnatMP-M77]|nr:hypothetical protein [Streptomyces sp. SID8364]SBU90510.1 hypothetical protein YW3DRAFT_00732 [Streptomyces sp. MnatMP-M77]
MTPHPRPSRSHVPRARSLSAALVLALLTVLTLVGGGASAAGAALAPSASRSPAPVTIAASAPTAPQLRHAGHDVRHRAGHDSRHRAGHLAASGSAGPDRARGAVAEPGAEATARAAHEQPRAAADPAQAPRAGTGRPYLLLHAPPPPHDALTPTPPGPSEPRPGVHHVAADSSDVPGGRRGALPGVRGPPGGTTGPSTGQPSCSADPAPRPH